MYELVIIGGGAAGLCAAHTAMEGGVKSIALIECQKKTGGNSAMAGGFIYALDTPQLKDSGLNDVNEELHEALYFHHYDLVEPALLRNWFEETKNTISWLESRGVDFIISNLGEGYTHLMSDSPGVSWFHNVLRPLAKELEEKGVDFVCSTTAKAILRDSNGRACGVSVTDADGAERVIEGRNVLLACGGFMRNTELLKKYFPLYYTEDSFYQVVPAPGNGIDLAKSAGALLYPECTLVKESGMCFKPGPNAPGRIFAMDGSVFINNKGQRIVDESLWNRNYSANAMLKQPGKEVYAIYSKETLASIMEATEPMDFAANKEKFLDYLEKSAAEGTDCRYFDTLDGLASWIGAEPETLRKTVSDYNGFCETGLDLQFMKAAGFLKPLLSGPYLAVKIQPMYIDTVGPVVIDGDMHILGEDYEPVPGLYAAGVIAAGWEGRDYMRFGSALSFSVTSGRMAGASIARDNS